MWLLAGATLPNCTIGKHICQLLLLPSDLLSMEWFCLMLFCGFTFQYGILFLAPFLSFLVLRNTADAAALTFWGVTFHCQCCTLPLCLHTTTSDCEHWDCSASRGGCQA